MDDLDDLELLSKDELIEMLSERADAGVNITFPGKAVTRRMARRVRPRIQRTIAKLSVGPPEQQARNHLIEGDNLQALVTLFKERGHADLIVTDPPYNTGNDFRYNDKWDTDPNDPGLGEFVAADDKAKHTKWMKFMWPRLQMMRAMLKPGGVLAICIDQRELFHLGGMLDELFHEKNRLAIINWQKSYSPKSDSDHVSTATEYVLVYAKEEDRAKTNLLDRTDLMDSRYQARDGDRRRWKSGDLSAGEAASHQPMVYAIQSPFTGELHYPPENRCWSMGRAALRKVLEQWGVEYVERDLNDASERARIAGVPVSEVKRGVKALMVKGSPKAAKTAATAVLKVGPWPVVYFGIGGAGRPAHKRYLEDVKAGLVPMTYWADDDHKFPEALGVISWPHAQSGHSQTGINELSAVVGRDHAFRTAKPVRLMEKIIQIWCPPDGLVLDPFAGSGTTGHAVLGLNHQTGADRRFILIEQGAPQRGDSYARTLTADRLTRVINGDWKNGEGVPTGGGFSFQQLTKTVDATALLQMERDEMVDTVIASYFDAGRRRSGSLERLTADYVHLVAKNKDEEGFYLIWGGPDKNTDMTEDVYEEIVAEGVKAQLRPHYHVYARYNLFATEGVRFYQIPDRILADFGLDVRTESFDSEEDQ
ncbi:adenine-specific DNA-methyltransferase [Nakamurella sp. UYEF19]|uniref:site-specific DNA-methyltransferase n=1 Tax=Nakamurella sp. UYEF19 TaxID=1756392 RepID=UPI003393D36C